MHIMNKTMNTESLFSTRSTEQYVKGAIGELERDFVQRHVVIGQGIMALN